jgi:uncharacterized membrane protein
LAIGTLKALVLPRGGKGRHKRTADQTIFDIGLIFKAVDGTLEIVGGILLALVGSGQLASWVRFLTQHELDGDADDVVVRFLIHSMQHRAANTRAFAIAFLVGHGVAKVGLVFALLKNYRWAYPIAIAIFGAFLGYQIYRFFLVRQLWLLGLSLIDAVVILLTAFEYWRVRGAHR